MEEEERESLETQPGKEVAGVEEEEGDREGWEAQPKKEEEEEEEAALKVQLEEGAGEGVEKEVEMVMEVQVEEEETMEDQVGKEGEGMEVQRTEGLEMEVAGIESDTRSRS